jgi:hypothetical protein
LLLFLIISIFSLPFIFPKWFLNIF